MATVGGILFHVDSWQMKSKTQYSIRYEMHEKEHYIININ